MRISVARSASKTTCVLLCILQLPPQRKRPPHHLQLHSMSMSPLTTSDNLTAQTAAVPDSDLEGGRPEQEFVMGKWEAELSDWNRHCIPNAWMACFCPCVSLAQISARIEPGSFRPVLMRQLTLNLLFWAGLIAYAVFLFEARNDTTLTRFVKYFVCLVVFIVAGSKISDSVMALHSRVRERFQIPVGDKYWASFCGACMITQMATQVKSYKPGSCAFSEPDALPAYVH